jgi:hypothetical protein
VIPLLIPENRHLRLRTLRLRNVKLFSECCRVLRGGASRGLGLSCSSEHGRDHLVPEIHRTAERWITKNWASRSLTCVSEGYCLVPAQPCAGRRVRALRQSVRSPLPGERGVDMARSNIGPSDVWSQSTPGQLPEQRSASLTLPVWRCACILFSSPRHRLCSPPPSRSMERQERRDCERRERGPPY